MLKIIIIIMEQNKITKCLKSYLTGKKYFDKDNIKSFEYFKQCIRLMDEMKNTNMIDINYKEIMDETEIECSKYLTLTIENTIDTPFIKKNKPIDILNKQNTSNEELNILFELIETGKLDEIKKYNFGDINFRIYNNNGLTPLHFAINFGDTSSLRHFFKIGAPIDITNKHGHTLLEYACLENDPNLIEFLYYYGADMKKHLIFRDEKKYFNNSNMIDIALLEKIIMEIPNPNKTLKYLDFIKDMIDTTILLDIQYENSNKNKIIVLDLIERLDRLLDCMKKDARSSYIDIIKDELSFEVINKLGCPSNKIEIILYNLVPFIGYTETLKFNWLIALEIKYILLKILKNKKRINIKELKEELNTILNESYLKSKIIPKGLIDIIVLQWIHKINV
jgi:ankyrin repeat protein